MVDKAVEYVRNTLSDEDLLCQLAEECAELGKAALKLSRVLAGRNPTPVKYPEAYKDVIEEIADVLLCIKVLDLNSGDNLQQICIKQGMKLARWEKRLKESEGDGNKRVSEPA